MFHNVIVLLELLPTYMTMIHIICDYTCGKQVSDIMYSGNVQESANGSSQNYAGLSLIHCEALGRLAWNAHS